MKISEKKVTLVFLISSILTTLIFYTTFENRCFSDSCTFATRESILVPGFWLFAGLSLVLSLFLFANDYIFKKWLKHIFWWYFLITIITISNTPTVSSNIFHIDKGQIALSSMMLLLPITIIYILIQRKRYTTMKEN